MRLQLLFKFHRARYDDQDTRRREHVDEVGCSPTERHGRNERNERQIDRTEQRDTVRDLLQVVFRRFTGTNTLDKAAVLLNTLRYVFGVELHLCVEEGERKDQQAQYERVHDRLRPLRGRRHPAVPELRKPAFRARIDQAANHLRETQNGEGENQRHNAATGNSDGNGRRLTAVHFSTFDLLCVLYGNFSFGKIDVNDRKENNYADEDKGNQFPERRNARVAACKNRLEFAQDGVACGSKDTYENNHRLTVAYAVVGDAFTDPHNDERACRVNHGHEHACKPQLTAEERRLNRALAVAEAYDDADRLNDGKQNRYVTGVLSNFLMPLFALFGQSFQRGNTYAQKLHNNRRVDIRSDTQSKNRALRQRTARDAAHQRQEVVARYRRSKRIAE